MPGKKWLEELDPEEREKLEQEYEEIRKHSRRMWKEGLELLAKALEKERSEVASA